MIKKLEVLLPNLDALGRQFYMNQQKEAFEGLSKMVPDINSAMSSFICAIPGYNKQGANLPMDVVVKQLSNLMDAMQQKDTIMIGDCLMYEISESLRVYKSILEDLANE